MKVLSLSLDKTILDRNSNPAKRVVEYGDLVDGLAFVAPDKDHKEVRLSEKVFVYGSGGGNKISKLINIYRLGVKILRLNKFDVITVQDQYYLALVGLFLAKKFKIGLELQIHGFEKFFGLRKIIAKFAIPRADSIRCASQRLKKQLINDFGAREEKITVASIRAEIKITNFENKISNRSGNDKFIFLTVGRLVPIKNIGLQIKATIEVIKKYPNTELWIVGDGQEMANCKRQIANSKLENNVKLLGWKNNPEEFYEQADAFLLTSDSEGWGMVIVEAMNFGLPIVMTDVGCAGELVENEKSGLIIPVNDQSKLEEAMARIIDDADLRKKMAENALLAVKNLPSKEETLALYRQSWEKAMKNK